MYNDSMMKILRLLVVAYITLLALPLIASDKIPLSGDYQLELEDPNHRHVYFLKPVHLIWEKSWQEKYPRFWDFLAHEKDFLIHDHPKIYDPSTHMVWLDSEESRRPYEIAFAQDSDGNITLQTSFHGVIADGKWMFVLMDDVFYLAEERKFQFHHTSLSGGQPVDCAGTMTVKEGFLTKLSLVSGHYRPCVEHGKTCLESLYRRNFDLTGLQMTYCVVQDNMVIKRSVTIEEFLRFASNDPDPSITTFFVPLEDMQLVPAEKVELFLTTVGTLWVGNSKLAEDDPLARDAGPFALRASAKIREGRLSNVVFNISIDLPQDVEKMQWMVRVLASYPNVNIEEIRFRILRNYEKVIVTYKEILEL